MKGKILMMMFLLACPMALLADDDPVQNIVNAYLDFLKNDLGYAGFPPRLG